MITQDYIEVKLGAANISHYKSKGYLLQTEKDNKGRIRVKKEIPLNIKVEDLPRTSNIKVEVECEDCGKKRLVQYNTLAGRENSQYLKTGETLCSKCANNRMSGKNSPVYKHGNILYPQYRNNAKRRNIEFNLSVNEFESLTPSICHYCGSESRGIDRIDSTKGYFMDNCVPCCTQCNFIKNNTPQKEFISKIVAMYNTFKKNKLI